MSFCIEGGYGSCFTLMDLFWQFVLRFSLHSCQGDTDTYSHTFSCLYGKYVLSTGDSLYSLYIICLIHK